MEETAREFDPGINWDRILDRPEEVLRFRRAFAFSQIVPKIQATSENVHLLACHLTFRWQAYLMRGFDPHLMSGFENHLRLFLTVVDDINDVHARLSQTDWGERKRLELALWRDEEIFITSLLADMYRKPHYVISRREPPANMAELIINPWRPKAYLSFPITAFKGKAEEEEVNAQIAAFRDKLREWLVVFDPFAITDYDLTYQVAEMTEIARELGEQTEQRDYRFIDQSEVLVAFFPRSVPSKGVEAEMRHARTSGKIIYLCHPSLSEGPFSVSPDYSASSPEELLEIIQQHFDGLDKEED